MNSNKVKINQRVTSATQSSLYLFYSVNKKRTKEALGLQIFTNPKTASEKKHNKETQIKAEFIRNERENQFFSDEIDETLARKKKTNSDFYNFMHEYVDNYTKKDKRMVKAALNAFNDFAPPPLSGNDVTESLCLKFMEYLSVKFKGETPASYFSRFKKVIRQAHREGYLKANPVENIKNLKTDSSIKKDVLDIKEIKKLINTHCGNEDVKKAFLFACNTGLRFVEINALKWENLRGEEVVIEQAKTGVKAQIPLNANALSIINTIEKKNEFVFNLGSANGVNKVLKNWSLKAGVEKKITFHCARHSFGTFLALYGNDVTSISKLLGHTSIKHTIKYIRIGKELKQKAVNSIPNFEPTIEHEKEPS
jgi:integrase/recombinase XerD